MILTDTPAWMTWDPTGIHYGFTDEPVPDICTRPGCRTIAADRCIHVRHGGSK